MAHLVYQFDQICEYCRKELFGRSDKKYCNDQCRNRANSKKRRWEAIAEDKHIYQITRDLKRNRTIMKSTGAFLGDPKIVTRGWMLDKGYNFEYFTNTLSIDKEEYHFCYEFGHRVLEDGRIKVIMTDRYIEFKKRIHRSPDEY